MGQYTKVILNREKYVHEIEYEAEHALWENRRRHYPGDELEGANEALQYILTKLKVDYEPYRGCETVPELLECVLQPKGIMYDRISLENPNWKKRTEYMIGFLEDGTAVALIPSYHGYSYLSMETGRRRRVTKKTKLQETAYTIYRSLSGEDYTFGKFMTFMLKLISIRDIVPLVIATALISALGLVIPALNRWVLGTVVYQDSPNQALLYGAVIFFTASFILGGIKVVRTIILGDMQLRLAAQVQSAVVSRVLCFSPEFFKGTASGKLSKTIAISRNMAERMVDIVLDSSFGLIFAFIYVPQMKMYAPSLYIPALLILASRLIMAMFLAVAYAQNQAKLTDMQMEERQLLFLSLKGIQKIKGFGAEKLIYSKWASLYQKMLTYHLDPKPLVKYNTAISLLFSSYGTIVLLGLTVMTGVEPVNYISFNASYAFVVAAVSQLISVVQASAQIQPLLRYLQPIFHTKIEQSNRIDYVRKVHGNIEIKDITFNYDLSSTPIIENFSLKVKAGEKIAIVGESGCGKSTLLKLLIGFEKPLSGEIYYDGQAFSTMNQAAFRKKIGTVFQFSRVMPGTIASNIAFSEFEIPEEELWHAAELADIDGLIRSLEMGMNTEITQSDVGGFSGGQRQCILLARAFVDNPSIVLLDEATSALDNITQQRVMDSIYHLPSTVIMVAHRLSTVKNCDRIIVMKEGHIMEEGNFKQLMEKQGYFSELVKRQLAQEEAIKKKEEKK